MEKEKEKSKKKEKRKTGFSEATYHNIRISANNAHKMAASQNGILSEMQAVEAQSLKNAVYNAKARTESREFTPSPHAVSRAGEEFT